jgi:hypothetical protein
MIEVGSRKAAKTQNCSVFYCSCSKFPSRGVAVGRGGCSNPRHLRDLRANHSTTLSVLNPCSDLNNPRHPRSIGSRSNPRHLRDLRANHSTTLFVLNPCSNPPNPCHPRSICSFLRVPK